MIRIKPIVLKMKENPKSQLKETEDELTYLRNLEDMVKTWPSLKDLETKAPNLHKNMMVMKEKLIYNANLLSTGMYDEPLKTLENFDLSAT